MEEERTAVKITVEYSDGTTRVMEKGLVFHITETEEKAEITAEMIDMAGKDLVTVVMGVIGLGDKLGLFEKGGETDAG